VKLAEAMAELREERKAAEARGTAEGEMVQLVVDLEKAQGAARAAQEQLEVRGDWWRLPPVPRRPQMPE